jgi:hypothetical protein
MFFILTIRFPVDLSLLVSLSRRRGPFIGVISMAGGRISVGYLTVPIGIRIWHGTRTWIGIDPVTTRPGDINVNIIAPAAAIILENVPARCIGKEPSFKPAGIIDISSILCF